MASNLDRQLEKELEKFLRENWKGILPVALIIGIGWLLKKYNHSLLNYYFNILTAAEKGIKLGAIVICLILTIVIARYIIVRKNEKKRYKYYRLLPRVGQEVETEKVEYLLKQLASVKRNRRKRLLRGSAWLHFFIYRNNYEISFYLGCPSDLENEFIQVFKNTYPQGEVHRVSEVPLPEKRAFSGRMSVKKHSIKQWFPFTEYKGGDQVGNLLSYLPANAWLSISFTPVSKKRIGKKLFKAEKAMKKEKKYTEMYAFQKEQFKDITSRLTGRDHAFKVAISIAGNGKKRRDIVKTVGKTVSTIMNNKNQLQFKRHINPIQHCPHPKTRFLYLTNRELGNLLHLPNMNHSIAESIPKLEKGQHHLNNETLNTGATVGYNLHPLVQERAVKVSFDQLTEHVFLSGMTGSGKSSLLIMAIQSLLDDWLAGKVNVPGFTMLDPAGATARTILNRLMKAETEGKKVPWNKVIFISYKNGQFPVGMNLLKKNIGEQTDTVVQNAMALFKTIYPADRTRIDKYLSNALTALIADVDDHHVLSVNKFLTDARFRNKIVNRSRDELLKDFWKNVDVKELKSVSADIYSRINHFEQSLLMRRVFGQSAFDLNIQRYMDEGCIVLLDVQGLHRVNTQFIGGHLINQYHQICQRRRPYSSREHLLILDESHLLQFPILEKIIAEDRKFNLALVLSTQFFGQYEDWLKAAVDGNVQNIFTGSQGMTEANFMANVLMKKQFTAELIAGLPNNTAAILTKGSDKSLTTCLVKTTPPYLYMPDGTRARYKNKDDINIVENWIDTKAEELQKRIGRPFCEVDEQINKYYGFSSNNSQNEGFYQESENKGGLRQVKTEEKKCTEQLPLSEEHFDIIEETSVYLKPTEKKKKESTKEKEGEGKMQDSFF